MAEITSQPTPGVAEAVTDQSSETPVKKDIETTEGVATNGEQPADGTTKMEDGGISEAIRKFRLKMGGKEEELDLTNPEHQERLRRSAQKGESADQRFSEAAMMRKQNEDFIRLLKTNPEAVLSNPAIGVDVKEWAEKFLWQRYQEAKMTPEQRKAAQNEKDLEQYRLMEKQQAVEKEHQRFEQEKAEHKGRFQADIIKTLETSGLPKTPRTAGRMAYWISIAKKNGWADVEAADVVKTVYKEYTEDYDDFFGALPSEKLKTILSPSLRKRFRELDKEDLKQPGQVLSKGEQPPANPEREGTSKKRKMSFDEWREKRRKMLEEE